MVTWLNVIQIYNLLPVFAMNCRAIQTTFFTSQWTVALRPEVGFLIYITMTVKKLIELLSKMEPNKQVVFDTSDINGECIVMTKITGIRQMCLDSGRSPVLIYNHDTAGTYDAMKQNKETERLTNMN